ncbi:LacI family DNA-binding transcriptional regulator [Nocardia cerradoensis]|uniref:HTH-type transcriptional regulator DegA n=1 Tax=Nocardia cerradoensis TaxID=85688 RepID=A0A231GU10_9NOCA|nr:LacI family DNA-binding transcriptional regulator [Nocardia cerradoensis]OXR40113.1 HTH-type transcriptional regulator DegA [Nocardia cerradoensis]
MVVSIREVAQRAGVSLGTVSNVLNRPEQVSPATRRRVEAAIAETGYVRNDSARQLREGSSRTLAMVVLDMANPFFTDVARGAESEAERAGAMLVLCNSGDDQQREQRHLEQIAQQRMRGVLITPVDGDGEAALKTLAAQGIPAVLVDRGSRRHDRCSVSVDDVLGGELAARHLIESGHRHLAFVGGPLTVEQVADRLRGAREASEEAGCRLDVVATAALTVEAGRAATETILDADPRPTALLCANDLLALGALQALTARGVPVPAEMAVIGYDDIDFAAAAAVPLSSVRQPRAELGRAAARLLLEEAGAQGDHRHQHVVFVPELVVRRSTGG